MKRDSIADRAGDLDEDSLIADAIRASGQDYDLAAAMDRDQGREQGTLHALGSSAGAGGALPLEQQGWVGSGQALTLVLGIEGRNGPVAELPPVPSGSTLS